MGMTSQPLTTEQLTTLLETVEGRKFVYSYGDDRFEVEESKRSTVITIAERDALCTAVRQQGNLVTHLQRQMTYDHAGDCAILTAQVDCDCGWNNGERHPLDQVIELTAECAALREQLASQRRELGLAHDTTLTELDRVRAVAKTEIERLEGQLATARGEVEKLADTIFHSKHVATAVASFRAACVATLMEGSDSVCGDWEAKEAAAAIAALEGRR